MHGRRLALVQRGENNKQRERERTLENRVIFLVRLHQLLENELWIELSIHSPTI